MRKVVVTAAATLALLTAAAAPSLAAANSTASERGVASSSTAGASGDHRRDPGHRSATEGPTITADPASTEMPPAPVDPFGDSAAS